MDLILYFTESEAKQLKSCEERTSWLDAVNLLNDGLFSAQTKAQTPIFDA